MSLTNLISFVYQTLPFGNSQPSDKATRTLQVPDLFTGILSGEPERNPHEADVTRKSEQWTKEYVEITSRS